MFAPRPRKTSEPQNDTITGPGSLSVVRCEAVSPGTKEFLVYQILGPPDLFSELPSDNLSAGEINNLESVDQFNIRQRQPKSTNIETTRPSEVRQTSIRSSNQADIVSTYGHSTKTNDDDHTQISDLPQTDTYETFSRTVDQDTDSGEQTEVDQGETPVRVRKRRVRDMSGRSRTPGWHICTQCSYTTHKRSMLEKHLDVHREKPRVKCNRCELTFANDSALKKHQQSHNTPYRCSQCDGGFSNYLKLEKHFMKEHVGMSLYSCKECNYSCSKVENMRRHVRSHTGERPYQCPHCTYAGADSFKLKRHILTHLGEKPYKCDTCGASFTQVNDLKTHKYKHSSDMPHACDTCQKTFARLSKLRTHIRKMHKVVQPTVCNICKATLPDRYTYMRHKQSHPVDKPHKCDKCTSSFARASDLRRHQLSKFKHPRQPQHINSKNLESLLCKTCNMVMPDEGSYRSHLEAHESVNNKTYKCDKCPGWFKLEKTLKQHQSSMHKIPSDRPHKCDKCPGSFKSLKILKQHLSSLHRLPSDRPHKCDKCTSSFDREPDLRRHQLLLHGPRNLTCERCQMILPDRFNYKLHILEHRGKVTINVH